MRSRVRGEGEEFREAPGSTRNPDSGDVTKGLVERSCVVVMKPHLAWIARITFM